MKDETTTVDNDYKQAFNQGYELSRELGLKPDIIKGLSAGNNRMQAMKDGMEQYAKDQELEKGKDKDIIPPLDMDSLDSHSIDLDTRDISRDKDKGLEK
jgi:hypothetical protein